MEVTFRTTQLRRNFEESTRAIRQWGDAVGRKYITRVTQLYAIKNFHEDYKVQSMRLHTLKGARSGELSISLTGRWRLIVTMGDSEENVVVKEVSNHYDD